MIEVHELVKCFEQTRALDGLSLHVGHGDVYGLVGPNGAGKSTLIRHLAGIYHQDAGTVRMMGQEIFENPAVKEKIAYIQNWSHDFRVFTFSENTLRWIAEHTDLTWMTLNELDTARKAYDQEHALG